MTVKIELEELDNGFILTLYDDVAPYNTDKHFHVKTLKEAIDHIVKYYNQILHWRSSEED